MSKANSKKSINQKSSSRAPSGGVSGRSGTKSGAGKPGKGSSFSVTKSNKSKTATGQDSEEECNEPPLLVDHDAI
jgi:hypothetical protein